MTSFFKLHYYLHAGDILSVSYEYWEVRIARNKKTRITQVDSETYLGKLNADKRLSNATDEALLSLLVRPHTGMRQDM
jgi:hypothetical protein